MNSATMIAVMVVAALVGWWSCGRFQSRARPPIEDPELMKTRAHLTFQLHASYNKLRADLLQVLVDNVLVEAEEAFYTDSLVWRRQYEANPSPENKSKCEFHFDNLQKLHSGWELNHPDLKGLIERIGNCREALFLVMYGTPADVQGLVADAKARGWGRAS